MPFMTSAVQLDEFLVDMLRVDAAAPLSPAVSEHADAVAGRPAATAHEAAVLLRGAAAVGSLCLTAGLARICGSPALRHRDERTRNAALPGMVLPKLTRPMSDAGHPARRRQPGGSRHVCALLVAGGTQPSSNLPNPTPCSLTAGCIEKADPRKVGDMPLTCQGWQPFVPCTAVIDRLCCCAVTAVQKYMLNGKLDPWPGSTLCCGRATARCLRRWRWRAACRGWRRPWSATSASGRAPHRQPPCAGRVQHYTRIQPQKLQCMEVPIA